jgi:hypothetical protein
MPIVAVGVLPFGEHLHIVSAEFHLSALSLVTRIYINAGVTPAENSTEVSSFVT